jgi:coenzyme F420-reducing hydrogenase beta subunit
MRSRESKEFMAFLSKKYNVSIEQVETMLESQFKFQVYIMKDIASKENFIFPSLRIKYFGKFVENIRFIKQYKTYLKNKKLTENETI